MRVFVYEWITGGGMLESDSDFEADHFFQQGKAMLFAAVKDFANAGHRVSMLLDHRLGGLVDADYQLISEASRLTQQVREQVEQSDAYLVIAPESDGILTSQVAELSSADSVRLGPNLDFVKLASSKRATTRWLAQRGIPVPQEVSNHSGQNTERVQLPWIAKPDQGAGSEHLVLLESPAHALALDSGKDWHVEEYVEGTAASVSVISGSGHCHLLKPSRQVLAGELGIFRESKFDLTVDESQRAIRLAAATAAALPPTNGYFGIDMILGEQDVVVEVNPRLTMSYCWLREVEQRNLAQMMVECAVES